MESRLRMGVQIKYQIGWWQYWTSTGIGNWHCNCKASSLSSSYSKRHHHCIVRIICSTYSSNGTNNYFNLKLANPKRLSPSYDILIYHPLDALQGLWIMMIWLTSTGQLLLLLCWWYDWFISFVHDWLLPAPG